jgi:hypothetical protein
LVCFVQSGGCLTRFYRDKVSVSLCVFFVRATKAGREAKWLETLFSSIGLEAFVHP